MLWCLHGSAISVLAKKTHSQLNSASSFACSERYSKLKQRARVRENSKTTLATTTTNSSSLNVNVATRVRQPVLLAACAACELCIAPTANRESVRGQTSVRRECCRITCPAILYAQPRESVVRRARRGQMLIKREASVNSVALFGQHFFYS